MMDKPMIDLDVLTEGGKVHNLSGHDRGVAAREAFGLDQLDQQPSAIEIRVPDHIYAISPSFIQGLLATSVQKAGSSREGFFKRFSLNSSDLIKRQFDRGLNSILTNRDFSTL